MAGARPLADLKLDMVSELAASISIPAVMVRRPNTVNFIHSNISRNASCKSYSKSPKAGHETSSEESDIHRFTVSSPDSLFFNGLIMQNYIALTPRPGPFESLVTVLKDAYHEFETQFNKWKQSFCLGDVGIFLWQYGFFSSGAKFFADIVYSSDPNEALYVSGGYQPVTDSYFEGFRPSCYDPLIDARNFAVLRGTTAIIFVVMNIFRRKQRDLLTSMVGGFGGGVMVSLVNGTRGPNVIAYGVFSALMHALNFVKMGGCDGDAMEWIEGCEKYLFEILVERVKEDPDGALIFKGTDWIEMDERIFMKYSLRYGPEKLKEKYHHMRCVHYNFSELINNTGVTWDFVSGKVFANDTVWDDFIKRDKIFKSFKKNGCKIYPLLSVVFGSSAASGAYQNASTCVYQTSQEKRRIEDEYLDSGNVGESEFHGGSQKDNHTSEGDTEGLHGTRRMKKSSGSTKYDTLIEEAWSQPMLTRKERDLAKAEQYMSMTGGVTSSLLEKYSIGDCMSTLEAIRGVSSRSYTRALTFFPDINWRKMFLMMSVDRRKEWLDTLNE